MKNCMDCTHLKMKIPITGPRKWICYSDATIKCSKGHLFDHDGIKQKVYTYKYAMTKGYLDFQEEAQRCPEFDGEEGE